MMMRPRNYSVLNRSIARGVSYALRDSNRKKYKYTNSNQNNSEANISSTIIAFCILFLFLLFTSV